MSETIHSIDRNTIQPYMHTYIYQYRLQLQRAYLKTYMNSVNIHIKYVCIRVHIQQSIYTYIIAMQICALCRKIRLTYLTFPLYNLTSPFSSATRNGSKLDPEISIYLISDTGEGRYMLQFLMPLIWYE